MIKRFWIAALVLLVAGAGSAQEDPNQPRQVTVSAKIVEFQATKGVDTGLSAYFQKREKTDWWGVVEPPTQGLLTADVTFPTSASAITVFLDRIRMTEGDIEMVLQALVDENRASILSNPKVMVMVGQHTNIQTTQQIPYENTTVVGSTAVQSTDFRPTGVTLDIQALEVHDFDGDWTTTEDTFVKLGVDASVSEEGQRIVIALDDQLVGVTSSNAIRAPEFVERAIKTTVWVRNGQVLCLGGLYSNAKTKSLATMPWLTQAEDMAVGVAERAVPGDFLGSPVSSVLGNRSTDESRRELVFFIKAEAWRPAYTVLESHGFMDVEEEEEPAAKPADVIRDVLEGVTGIPENIGEGIKKTTGSEGIESELGGGN